MNRFISQFAKQMLFLALLLNVVFISNATVRYVNVAATGANNGTNWTNAYTNLQVALDACLNKDTLLVAEGIYYPTQSPDGTTTDARDRAFHLADTNVVILGGWNATAGTRNGSATILSGNLVGAGTASANAYHIMVLYALDSTTVFDKLTFTYGESSGSGSITYRSTSYDRFRGGAIFVKSASPTFNDLTFHNNFAQLGGALFLATNASPKIRNSVFSNNVSSSVGGAIYINNSNPQIVNTVFNANSGSEGGAIYNLGSSPVFTNLLFISNYAGSYGGALCNINNCAPILTNVNFIKNHAATLGKAIFNNSTSSSTIYNSFFYQNTGSGSVIDGTINSATTHNATDANLSLFPNTKIDLTGRYYNEFFKDSTDWDGADDIYFTQDDGLAPLYSSTLLKAGNISIAPNTDITSATRPGVPSIGAYDLACANFSDVLYVNAAATGANTANSWSDAFVYLQDALDVRMTCGGVDTIKIAEGIYYPTTSPDGTTSNARDKAFHLADSNVVIYGGWNATTGTRNGGATVLSGDLVTAGTATDSAYHVMVAVKLNNTTVLDKLTFSSGKANGSSSFLYRSIRCYQDIGGAIFNGNSNLSFHSIVFNTNSAISGGAIWNQNSTSLWNNVSFINNNAVNYGGAIFNSQFTGAISNALFISNAAISGGAIYNANSNHSITNATFIKNSSTSLGNAIYNSATSLTLKNTLFFKNTGSAQLIAGSSLNSSSTHNAADADTNKFPNTKYSLIGKNFNDLFKDSTDWDGADNVLMTQDDALAISYTSLLLNKKGTATGAPSADIAGYTRPALPSVGAYELYCTGTTTYDTFNTANCYSYTSPSGKIWNTAGTYNDTINNSSGCDSVLTIHLTILNRTYSSISYVAAASFVSPSGKLWTASATYKDTIPNAAGCDSVMTIVLSISPCYLSQQTLYVNGNNTGNGFGTSWSDAFPRLQDALDVRMACGGVDTIHIAEGIYYPTSSPDGTTTNARNMAFHLADSNVVIYGGWNATTGTRNGGATVLSGDLVTAGTATDSAYHVMVAVYLNNTSVFDKLTFSSGKANGNSAFSYRSITCSQNRGGAIFNSHSNVSFNAILFTNNSAALGGAMWNEYSTSLLNNVSFVNNNADAYGGAVYNFYFTGAITNAVFINNSANTYGGAIFDGSSNHSIINASFVKNSSITAGNAIYNSGTNLILKNSVFFKNTGSAQLISGSSLNSSSTHNAIDADTNKFPNIKYSLIGKNFNDLFKDSTDWDGADNVLMTQDDALAISYTSLLLNKRGTATGAPSTDITGYARPALPSVGAYELYCTGTTTYDTFNTANCYSYTSPSGKIWNTAGTYNDTINNSSGCDSVLTIHLTILNRTYSSSSYVAAISFLSPSGKLWTASATYKDTIPNAAGCDSVMTIVLAISPCYASQQTLYVNTNNTGNGFGTSWSDAFPRLQDALDVRMACGGVDTIHVAEGIYYPTSSPDGTTTNARNRSFHLADSNVVIYGGWNATTGVRNGGATVLSGDLVTAGTATDSAYHIMVAVYLNNTTIFDKLTFSSGKANGSSTISYRSITCFQERGGAIFNSHSNVSFRSIVFNNNSAKLGGAMWNEYSTSLLNNVSYTNNNADVNGGAMFNYIFTGAISNAIFINNTAIQFGGAIINSSSNHSITNTSFVKNRSITSGNAIYNGASSLTLKNTLFFKNTGSSNLLDGSSLNSASTHNAADADTNKLPNTKYSLIGKNYNDLFKDSTDWDGADNVLMTQDDALAISYVSLLLNKKGTATGAPSTDIAGYTRPALPSVGAYELYCTGTTTYDTLSVANCYSYTSPNGKIWNTAGTYNDTINNSSGCDSVLTFYVTILNTTYSSTSYSAAASFLSQSGKLWTTSGTYKDTIPNAAGCDSVMTIVLSISPCSLSQQTLYVNANNTGNRFGTSWSDAFPRLQDALDVRMACGDVDTIHIAEGIYYPTSSPDGTTTNARNRSFHLADSNVVIYGGWNATTGTRNGGATVLSGDLVTSGSATDSAYHVMVAVYLNNTTIFDKLTFSSGKANGSSSFSYRSIICYPNRGGAIFNSHSDVSFNAILFTNNSAAVGGAMWNEYSASLLNNVSFINNNADAHGGAVYNYYFTGAISNAIFINNTAISLGGAIINSGSSHTITNASFIKNRANNSGNAISNSGASSLTLKNTLFFKNTGSSNLLDGSSLNSASTHNASDADTNKFPNTKYSLIGKNFNDLFKDSTDWDGADNVLMTADDALALKYNSLLKGVGTTGSSTDITGANRPNPPSIGAYELAPCSPINALATDTNTTNTSAYSSLATDGWKHYCSAKDELLLSLKIGTSGAVINDNEVEIKLGSTPTFSSTQSGGLIANTNGYAMIDRRWNVNASAQPNAGHVGVRYYFTNVEYDSIKTALANLASATTINAVTDLQMFKSKTNVSGGAATPFANPHTTNGIVLLNGSAPDTNVWVLGTQNTINHFAEFEVASFSGGGGGGGGGNAPLPVELIDFTAAALPGKNAQLNWITASEINNSHFAVERRYENTDFEQIAIIKGNGNSQTLLNYTYLDSSINTNQFKVYYRLQQFDFNGDREYSEVRKVVFDQRNVGAQISVYPNPFKDELFIATDNWNTGDYKVKIISINGVELLNFAFENTNNTNKIDLSNLKQGVYFISVHSLNETHNFKIFKR